jgi:predicted tellurium resistance membrane protein TerC
LLFLHCSLWKLFLASTMSSSSRFLPLNCRLSSKPKPAISDLRWRWLCALYCSFRFPGASASRAPLFTVFAQEISGRDLILLIDGLFLIAKSTHEIHQKLEGEEGHSSAQVAPTFASVIIQILLLDAVFSLDSVITAVGMVNQIGIMVSAVIVAVLFMMVFAGPIGRFVERHPTVKMLALSFLLLIGMTLIAEGFDQHIPKGYIYSAMAFSVFGEMLNLNAKKPKAAPVKLHQRYAEK